MVRRASFFNGYLPLECSGTPSATLEATMAEMSCAISFVGGVSFRPLEAEPLSMVENPIVNGWQFNCQRLRIQLSVVDKSILNG